MDLTPDTEPANLARLAAALNELDCRLVADSADTRGWVALPADYFTPRARPVAGTAIIASVAALEDIHESKRRADRPKDREYLRWADAEARA